MKEIDKLRQFLKDYNIEYENFIDETPKHSYIHGCVFDTRNQILIRFKDEPELKISCICHWGSYGASKGLIEFYDFNNDPVGFLTAAKAFELILDKLEEWEEQKDDE